MDGNLDEFSFYSNRPITQMLVLFLVNTPTQLLVDAIAIAELHLKCGERGMINIYA